MSISWNAISPSPSSIDKYIQCWTTPRCSLNRLSFANDSLKRPSLNCCLNKHPIDLQLSPPLHTHTHTHTHTLSFSFCESVWIWWWIQILPISDWPDFKLGCLMTFEFPQRRESERYIKYFIPRRSWRRITQFTVYSFLGRSFKSRSNTLSPSFISSAREACKFRETENEHHR